MSDALFAALAAGPTGLHLPPPFGAADPLLKGSFVASLVSLLGAALFFWGARPAVPQRWQPLLTLASLSCLVAGTHYGYMLLHYQDRGLPPTGLRYVNWLVSGPLLCTQFYLLLRPWGASRGALARLVLAHCWLVGFGYLGEAANSYWILLWGAVAALGSVVLLHEIWFGPLARLVDTVPDPAVGRTFTYLSSFWLVSWLLYPLGYLSQPFQVLAQLPLNPDLVYNVADVVNLVGGGVVVYRGARQAGCPRQARPRTSRGLGRGGLLWASG